MLSASQAINLMNSFADHIRGCLRIMGRLTRKGVKKLRPVIEVEPEEELASPLIRFISVRNHITLSYVYRITNILYFTQESPSALAEQLARYAAYDFENDQKVPPHLINQDESYMIYAEEQVFLLGADAVQAIDTFIKFFCVFNHKVPASLVKLVELIEIISYRVKQNSCRRHVNELCAKLMEFMNANSD